MNQSIAQQSKPRKRPRWGRSLSLLLLLGAGCAAVRVNRVKPDDYDTEGFRFYLPRPYLAVKAPFPVGGTQVIVGGTLSGGKIVGIDTAGLSADLRSQLGVVDDNKTLDLPLASVMVPANQASQAARGVVEQSDASPESLLAAPAWLSGSVTPAILQADVQTAEVSVTLSDKHPFTSATSVEVGILPLDKEGQPESGKFIAAIPELPPTFQAAKALTYKGLALRDSLKGSSNFVAAVRVVGQVTGAVADSVHLAHVKGTSLAVVAGEEPEKKPSTETTETTETKTEADAKTNAKVQLSGDPATSPLQKVGDYFDVLYLQDFDQQYAVRVTGGLGKASLDLGLENGWMVEKAQVEIDNSKLGEFIFTQTEKIVDLGLDLVRLDKGLLTPATGEEGEAVEQSLDGQRVLLKITYVKEAQPGLYPLLKPGENASDNVVQGDGTWLHLPTPPFTVVAFNTTTSLLVELLTDASQSKVSEKVSEKATALDLTTIKAALQDLKIGLGGPAAPNQKAAIDKVVANLQTAKLKGKELTLTVGTAAGTADIDKVRKIAFANPKTFSDKFAAHEISTVKVVEVP